MNKSRAGFQQVIHSVPIPVLILGICVLIITLFFVFKPTPAQSPQANNLPLVETMSITPGPHQPVVTLFGQVESPQESNLSATVNALVAQVPAQEGERVSLGQTLVQLDDRDARLALQEREAEVKDIEAQIDSELNRHNSNTQALTVEKDLSRLAQKSVERYEKLSANNLGSAMNRDEALQQAQSQQLSLLNRQLEVDDHENRLARLNAQLLRAQALRDQAQLDLERSKIVSPFKLARITAVKVSPGNLVRPGEPLVSLFNLDQVEIRAQLPSRHLNAIQDALNNNKPLSGTLNVGNRSFPVTLKRLAGTVGSNRGGIDGLFSFQEATDNIILGRTGELHLLLPEISNSILVPPNAVYGQERIYQIIDGVLHTVLVERLGEARHQSGELWPLLRAELPQGTEILVTQLTNAVGGLPIKVATDRDQQQAVIAP